MKREKLKTVAVLLAVLAVMLLASCDPSAGAPSDGIPSWLVGTAWEGTMGEVAGAGDIRVNFTEDEIWVSGSGIAGEGEGAQGIVSSFSQMGRVSLESDSRSLTVNAEGAMAAGGMHMSFSGCYRFELVDDVTLRMTSFMDSFEITGLPEGETGPSISGNDNLDVILHKV